MTVQPLVHTSLELIAEIEAGLDLGNREAVEARLFDLVAGHERHLDQESLGLNAGTTVP